MAGTFVLITMLNYPARLFEYVDVTRLIYLQTETK